MHQLTETEPALRSHTTFQLLNFDWFYILSNPRDGKKKTNKKQKKKKSFPAVVCLETSVGYTRWLDHLVGKVYAQTYYKYIL